MKTKLIVSFFLFCGISLVLQACNYSGTPPVLPPTELPNSEVPINYMETPFSGSIHSVGDVIDLEAYVVSISSLSITEITFLVNGTSVGAAGPSSRMADWFSRSWTAPQIGEYYIQSRAVLSDGAVSISNPVRVCVISLANRFDPTAFGYMGSCEVPTRIPHAASSGQVSISASVAPATIYYSTDPVDCPLNYSIHFSFIARVDDPQDLVAFVTLNLIAREWTDTSFLNWVTTRPVNQKEYRTSFTWGGVYAGEFSDAMGWVIHAIGRDGQILQSIEGSIPVRAVNCTQQSLQIATPGTSIPSPTPEILSIITPTPTSTVSPKILYIPSPTKKPKRDNGNGNPAPGPTQPCNPLIKVCP